MHHHWAGPEDGRESLLTSDLAGLPQDLARVCTHTPFYKNFLGIHSYLEAGAVIIPATSHMWLNSPSPESVHLDEIPALPPAGFWDLGQVVLHESWFSQL